MSDLIHRGGAVKALPNGHVEGYLVVFGSSEQHDLSAEKDYFTSSTDFGLEDGMKSAVYYAHALDPTIKNRRLTNVSMKVDEVGVWVEGQIKARDEYEKALLKMAQDGKLGWSSGTASHLVTRKAVKTDAGTVHEILSWPLGLDASLTPCPAEPRANASYTLKSLAAMIEADAPADPQSVALTAEDHTTKALPSGMSYDDLRALLSDELNEDFPDTDDDDTDAWAPGYYIRDVYDDAVVYSDEEDLFRRTYTVTAGNDVVWGPEESVVRVTTYATATDSDDDAAEAADTTVPITGKQADVAALKVALTRSMTFGDHADVATSAMEGFVTRAASLDGLSIKSGRAISAANLGKMKAVQAGMQVAHDAMAQHIGKMADIISGGPETTAKKDADEVAVLRMQHLRLQSRRLGVAV